MATNKKKHINDPIYGFITIPDEFLFDMIEHPYFQRLRRIKQLGLTDFVYPSATHTRFQHALGCLFLMKHAIGVLRAKGSTITPEEEQGLWLSILLHDIGHGPFSHTLERSIVTNHTHEDISLMIMEKLNTEFGGKLSLAIAIFKDTYPKKFLHQLVSGQLDMDRLDYLSRDSFYTGVAEGVINADRIINMLQVVDDKLVVEEKGIYSIEKFILARRLMYWQVYLHKTVLAADYMLGNILRRAKFLADQGKTLFSTPALHRFLTEHMGADQFRTSVECLNDFTRLDDSDILSSIKVWVDHSDPILSVLCRQLINRQLSRVEIQNEPFDPDMITKIHEITAQIYHLRKQETSYFVVEDCIENDAYHPTHENIQIYTKSGSLLDLSDTSEQLNLSVLIAPNSKHLLCYPKPIHLQ